MKKKLLYVLVIFMTSARFVIAQDISGSTVEIYSGISAIGMGFVYPDQYHVVTALHVVAGRENFKIRSYTTGVSGFYLVAEVEKISKEADLALLRLAEPLNVIPVTLSVSPPYDSNRYYVYRTSPGGSKVAPSTMRLESNLETLDFFINSRTRQLYEAIKRQDYPRLTAKIVRVIDPVRKGDSGAPICDQQGNLIGVVDGGLYKGLRAYNWGIFSSHLQELNSQPSNPAAFASIQKNDPSIYLVTDNVEDSKPLQFNNGKVSLEKVFTTTVNQINATMQYDESERKEVEDHYDHIAKTTGRYLRNAIIDVYQDSNTGATIAIPHGLVLSSSESDENFFFLEASSPSGKVKMTFAIVDDAVENMGDLFTDYVMSLDPNHALVEAENEYDEYTEDDYEAYDYLYRNDRGGEAAMSLLYSGTDFMGLSAYIVDNITSSPADEYYFALFQECVYFSDYPAY